MEVVVEYDYDAVEDDELTIRKGDVITQVTKENEGWWQGVLNGKKGMFPDNFVKVKSKISVEERKPSGSSGPKARRCRVAYSYVPQNNDELALTVDDVIEILGEVEDGWWRGIYNNKEGVFPSNFVVELSEDDDKSTVSPKKDVDSSSRKESAVDEKPRTESKDDKHVPSLPPKPVKEQAKVLYHYQPQNSDELELIIGNIITVIDKELDDKGWWKGEINGKVGVFPDNFVALISEKKTKPPRVPDRPPGNDVSLSPTTEVKKTDDGKPPPVPGKKPSVPPGPKRGSLKVGDRSPAYGELLSPDSSQELDFDSVEQGGSRLSHPTALRPRGPKRRPPSPSLMRASIHDGGDMPNGIMSQSIEEIQENGDPDVGKKLTEEKPEKKPIAGGTKVLPLGIVAAGGASKPVNLIQRRIQQLGTGEQPSATGFTKLRPTKPNINPPPSQTSTQPSWVTKSSEAPRPPVKPDTKPSLKPTVDLSRPSAGTRHLIDTAKSPGEGTKVPPEYPKPSAKPDSVKPSDSSDKHSGPKHLDFFKTADKASKPNAGEVPPKPIFAKGGASEISMKVSERTTQLATSTETSKSSEKMGSESKNIDVLKHPLKSTSSTSFKEKTSEPGKTAISRHHMLSKSLTKEPDHTTDPSTKPSIAASSDTQELKEEVQQLKKQVSGLCEAMEAQKRDFLRRLRELMQEIDEGKKQRLALNVEIERLEKLILDDSSASNV